MSNQQQGLKLRDTLQKYLKENNLEESFLKSAGLTSMNELDPIQFLSDRESIPPVIMKPSTSSAPIPQKQLVKSSADAVTGFHPRTASDMLKPYIGLKINYVSRKAPSSYQPSSLMMDYIVHQVNDLLVDNFYFRRACPDYHPYILRLYYGVLFWIQSLRAMAYAKSYSYDAYQTLTSFLSAFPLESLPISSPLLNVFKSLCCSQPEIPTYGIVYPKIPDPPGPAARSTFIRDGPQHHILPNIPGIFALLKDLEAKINPAENAQAVFPAKGKHIPVTSTATAATIFGHCSFPVPTERTEAQKWSLSSSGLQYLCEADKKLHESFAERIGNYGFPTTTANDSLATLAQFLHVDSTLAWFAQVREVAAAEASFFEGSGTLADCPPFGISSNQIVTLYRTAYAPPAPRYSADTLSTFPFSIRLRSSARTLVELAEATAAFAQTNVVMPANHPFYGALGDTLRTGAFWSIQPVESSITDESSYLSLNSIIRGLMKPKG